ncbi:MAG: LacI family DNA-binding transcriptional regulator [Chloroflexota bacterium]
MVVTSHDVARLAGVSQPTVSRALRGDQPVSEATRQRVARAAEALGYVPSEVGRSLSTRATRQIAMGADLENPLYPGLVAPIHDALMDLGYRMVVLAERGDEASTYERLLDRSVDGAILTTSLLRSSLPYRLHQRGLPFVQLNRVSDLVDADSVTADNWAGANAVAHLLLDFGHRKIGAIFGPAETSTARDREAGFREVLEDGGVALPARRVYRGSAFSYADGNEGFTQLLRRRDHPTAVVCANDIVAVGALNAAVELGIRVPQDLTVIGFDDLDVAAWPCFRLTTVRIDLHAMARRAAELLVKRLGGDESGPVHERFPAELVLRHTHASR